jgi:polyhydroxyalkanoate synthase
MNLIPTVGQVSSAAANAFDLLLGGGIADLRRTPASIIDEGPQRTVYRYLASDSGRQHDTPVLLVPPLAAPTSCFDLRRGCSLAEHLLAAGHPTYLVEYGDIAFSDRDLGLEHWVEDVIPAAIEAVHRDAGGTDIHLVGWCLGGIMSLLSVAGLDLPVRSVATVASPFDFRRVRIMSPIRPVAKLTGGRLLTVAYRALGGAPAPLVKRAFQLSALDKQITKPVAIARHLDDREFLAQIEAVDHFTRNMHAYPGRTMGQLYHRFFRVNDLAEGRLVLSHRTIDLADVRVPVMSVAGRGDVLAPRAAVHHVGRLLPNAPEVRIETAPGGHLGVLTGRSAARTTWTYLDEFLADYGTRQEPATERPHLSVVA